MSNSCVKSGARTGALRIIQAAIWSEAVGLIVEHSRVERNAQWGTWVRPSLPHETSDVNGIDLASLLVESGHHAIDIVKIDIEGAETAIFAQDCRSWLDSVAVIEIELHGDEGGVSSGKRPVLMRSTIPSAGITVAIRTPVKETNAAFGRHRCWNTRDLLTAAFRSRQRARRYRPGATE
jgi:FkbM family methyltransferase